MRAENRAAPRWPSAAGARVTLNNQVYNSNILNVNLGGCFFEGAFPARVSDIVLISSDHNQNINGLRAQVVWVVNEPDLQGIGVKFEPINEQQQFELIKWFNAMVPASYQDPNRPMS